MGTYDAVVWTPERDALLGTMSDEKVGKLIGCSEAPVSRRRRALCIPSYRSTRAPVTVECANCGDPITRPQKHARRAKRLFCGRTCADAGQKTRDSETLRYGPGWPKTREKIRARDKVCQSCGDPPGETALHVHHLVPYRFGGTNHPSNLVALCDSCHHRIEKITEQTLASIPVEITLDGSTLTITVDNVEWWHGSVAGAGSPTPTGSTP